MNIDTEKAMTWMNFLLHFKDSLLGKEANSTSKSNDSSPLKAHKKGEDQADERLTLTSFARATQRLQEEPYNLDEAEAIRRVLALLTIINEEYNPNEIRCISLTFGLEQNKIEREIPQGKGEDGKEKKPVKKIVLENKDGQDMAMMLLLANDEKFTKAFLQFAISSTQLFKYNLEQWKKTAFELLNYADIRVSAAIIELNSGLDSILPLISVEHPAGLYRPPIWTDFLLWGRKAAIERCRQQKLQELRELHEKTIGELHECS